MKNYIIVFFVIIALALIGVIIWGFGKTGNLPSYSSSDENRPIVEVKESSYDLGTINATDVREHFYTLKNIGKSDLVISQITTSCGCTSAYILQDGNESPEFTMHKKSNWRGTIKPDETVQVKAVYDPKTMPVTGKIERYITMASNDPISPSLEFKLIFTVVK